MRKHLHSVQKPKHSKSLLWSNEFISLITTEQINRYILIYPPHSHTHTHTHTHTTWTKQAGCFAETYCVISLSCQILSDQGRIVMEAATHTRAIAVFCECLCVCVCVCACVCTEVCVCVCVC